MTAMENFQMDEVRLDDQCNGATKKFGPSRFNDKPTKWNHPKL